MTKERQIDGGMTKEIQNDGGRTKERQNDGGMTKERQSDEGMMKERQSDGGMTKERQNDRHLIETLSVSMTTRCSGAGADAEGVTDPRSPQSSCQLQGENRRRLRMDQGVKAPHSSKNVYFVLNSLFYIYFFIFLFSC